MKLKSVLSVFMVVSMLISGVFVVNASADDGISYKISYSSKYTYLELEPSDENHTIRYTIDGSVPDEDSALYKGRLRARATVTLRVAEFDEDGNKVDAIKIGLRRKCQKAEVKVKKKDDGYKVTLTTDTEDAVIYYTTDGSKPSKKSTEYDGSFMAEEGDIIYALVVKEDWKNSAYTKYEIVDAEAAEEAEEEPEYDKKALEVLEIVNECRAEKGLPALEMDPVLYKAAQIRAEELYDSYSHTRPDDTKWYTVLGEVDFDYAFAGENIAYTEGKLSTPEKIMELWMDSEIHRDNILNDSGSLIGIGIFKHNNKTYWIQLFGERK